MPAREWHFVYAPTGRQIIREAADQAATNAMREAVTAYRIWKVPAVGDPTPISDLTAIGDTMKANATAGGGEAHLRLYSRSGEVLAEALLGEIQRGHTVVLNRRDVTATVGSVAPLKPPS